MATSGHGLNGQKAGVLDAALDAAVLAQGDFTGDKFLKVLEMAAPVASGLNGIFEYVSQTQAAEVVLESGAWGNRRGVRRSSL